MSGESDKRSEIFEATARAAKGAASAVAAPAVELDGASLDLIQQPGNEDLLTFYRHWEGLRSHPTEIPPRDRFDPIEIPRLLGRVLLAEVIYEPTVRVRYRILGSQIVDTEGANHAGKFLDEINPDPDTVMRRHYMDLIERGRMYVRKDTAYWSGRPHVAYSILLLPLSSDDGQMSHILGFMQC